MPAHPQKRITRGSLFSLPCFFAAATPRHPGVMKETCAGSGVDLAVRGKQKSPLTLSIWHLFFFTIIIFWRGFTFLLPCIIGERGQ